jgi:hypothetical protein
MRAGLVAFFLVLASPLVTHAQADDIVELRGGSFVRGTIVERIEGSHVVVQTASGELRRFDLDQVIYAGPVERRTRRSDGSPASALGSPIAPPVAPPVAREIAPPIVPPSAPRRARRRPPPSSEWFGRDDAWPLDGAPPLHPPSARSEAPRARGEIEVRVRSRDRRPGLVLHAMVTSSTATWGGGPFAPDGTIRIDAFRPLCVSPCTVDLHRGAYVFGVSRGESPTLRVRGVHQLSSDLDVEIEYVDHGVERVLGVLTLIAGVAGGAALAVFPALEGWSDPAPMVITGAVIAGLSLIIGVALVAAGDGVELRVMRSESGNGR